MRLAQDQVAIGDGHRLVAPTLLRSQLPSLLFHEVAWKIANQLGWSDTFDAEYVALTQLQADAFVTLDPRLASAASELVKLAPIEELFAPEQ